MRVCLPACLTYPHPCNTPPPSSVFRASVGFVAGAGARDRSAGTAERGHTEEEETVRRSTWWLAALAAVLLVAGACGGGDDKEMSSSGATSAAPAAGAGDAAGAPKSEPAGAARAAAPAGEVGTAPRSGAQGTEQGQTAGQPVPSFDRKIVYNVSMELTVKDVRAGMDRITALAVGNGGLVTETNLRQEGDKYRGSVTIRVPAGRYLDVMTELRGLAVKVENERSSGSDVTEEFIDLQSRQRNLEAVEQQLLVFLGQTKTVQESLQVQDRLNAVRGEIERVKGRLNAINRLTDLATIQVQLRPEAAPAVKEPKPEPGPVTAIRRGWEASLDLVGGLALVLLTVTAFSWWLLPPAALALWLWRRGLRRSTPEAVPAPDTAT